MESISRKKCVWNVFEVFYLYRYIYIFIIKVHSIESTWVTNNGEVGCLWRTGPTAWIPWKMPIFSTSKHMFGFVGNNIRVESERKSLQLEKNSTMFSWFSNHARINLKAFKVWEKTTRRVAPVREAWHRPCLFWMYFRGRYNTKPNFMH